MPAPDTRIAVLPTPFPGGQRLALHFDDKRLIALDILPPRTPLASPATPAEHDLAERVEAYFHGADLGTPHELPPGTAFQQRVWRAICAIPYGRTRTYGELATELDSAARAVAAACRRNPWPLLIPCHRVVAAHGPGGYAGAIEGPLVALKTWLLSHEQGRHP